MKKYIIGVDLDGTLLTSNKEITDRTLWVIEQAVRKGNLQKEVVAIGDSNNELDMMEKAGFSIAMENASKQVKKAADVVTSSNDRDGVAEAIIKFIM